MNEHVILFCNLEHLPPHDVAATTSSPGKWAFGLNISVGINDQIAGVSLEALRPFMKPWTWPQINQVKVRVRDEVSGRTTTETIPALKWKGDTIDCAHCRDEQTALRNDLDAEYMLSEAKGFDAFKWQPKVMSKTSNIKTRPWHTLVGQLSTNPPPFPQCLNLSFIFFVDKLDTAGRKSVFAAPILPHTSATCMELVLPFGAKLVPKDDAPQEWTGHPGIFQWPYETEGGATPNPPLIAHMAECPVRLAGAQVDPFLDLDSQWVGKLTSEPHLFDEDWRSMLEERMADALDVGQRIIEYLRLNLENVGIIPLLKLFQWAAIASFRDVAGVGIHPGPDKRRFIDVALKTSNEQFPGLTDEQELRIENNVKAKFGTLKNWLIFLSTNLPEVSKLSVLSLPRAFMDTGGPTLQLVVPEEQATVSSVVAELEQLHKAIFDQKNLVLLVRKQWREVCRDVLSDREMELIEKADLDSLNVRHNLALENLGDLWKIFTKMPSTSASGHDLIRQNFPCLFQEYFCQRFNLSLAGLSVVVGGVARNCDVSGIQSAVFLKRQPQNVTTFEPPSVPPSTLPFPLNDIRQALVEYIKNWSQTFVENLLPQTAVEPTTVPHAITMQVDGLAGILEDSSNPNEQDILRRISGVGILMRKQGADWRCLNMAAALGRSSATPIADPVLVPSRLNYRNDLRQAFISYNNHPVTAQSPVAEDEMTKVKLRLKDEGTMTPSQISEVDALPLLRFKYSNDAEARRLPGLEFGATFEILPFMVANCGALPTALLADDPARRSPIQASPADFSVTKLSDTDRAKIREITYLRKVRVGSARVFDNDGKVQLKLPSIPETVFPRARDIHKEAMESANSLIHSETKLVSRRDPAEHPLLLLAPDDWAKEDTGAISKFGFCIRKPATDLNTWDRWIAGRLSPEVRASVWADFYRQSEKKRTNTTPTQGFEKFQLADTSIDDPATLNQLFFELWKIDGTSTSPIIQLPVAVVPSDKPDPLAPVQSQLMHVTCQVGAAETITDTQVTTVGGKQVKDVIITVKKGEVYQLNVFTCIAKDDYDRRFADVITSKRGPINVSGVPAFLVSPFSMLIETATEDLIEGVTGLPNIEHRLWQRLNPAFAPADHPGAIAFSVAPSDGPTDEGFKFLQRAELLRQVWRWQGRETPLHPCLKATSSCKQNGKCTNLDNCIEMDEWEAWEFGNRFETDHLLQDMRTKPPTRLGGRKFFYKEVLETGSAETDELRALHYRFAIRVFSRYAGIMPAEVETAVANVKRPVVSSVLSKSQTPLPGNKIKETIWRRLFVPCRRQKPLPTPKVKLILPLTESFGEELGNTAGLLLVLNEPWYQEAGLGEGIAAEVQMTPAPENNPNAPSPKDTFYFELGTDPLVELVKRGYQQSKDPVKDFDEICLSQKIRGPVGHSFDRTNESPLFTATSFIIPAPTIFSTKAGSTEKEQRDFAWNFCRLRLRRVVALSKEAPPPTDDCNLITAAGEVTSCTLPAGNSQLEGPFTDPYWVQYLPEFSHFASGDLKLTDARLKFEKSTGSPIRLSIVDRGEQPILLSPAKSLTHIFELYLVLTRRVFDVTGRPEQENYQEVFHPVGEGKVWETSGDVNHLSSDDGLRARIIEVQRRPSPAPLPALQPFSWGEPLWTALFGPKLSSGQHPEDKDLARIVRISPPIESLSAGPNC